MKKDWIRDYVDVGDFEGLFVEELGWDRPGNRRRTITVPVGEGTYIASEVATYRGVGIWSCSELPTGQAQRAIDKALSKESAERVLIFHDADRQIWRWPQTRDAAGAGSPRLVSHEHVVGRSNEALRQRLQFVELDLEQDLSVLEVVRRLRKAFDSDRVTKAFYSRFAQQHRDLTAAISGIRVSDEKTRPEQRWYGSILLNRLMFIYFMQRKGFLDGDVDYLRNRLERVRQLERPGSFYEFYKDFLIPLFHEGLGADEATRQVNDPVIAALLGDIPYVNGGIFAVHPLEAANDIRVPDDAFETIFNFFDQWQWHLDDRPSGNPNEINPDVLGYIFEQFVNNREEVARGDKDAATNVDKGAYYTKEDVTGFMTSNALVPAFLERIQAATTVNVWRPLSLEPARYVWSSLAHGADEVLPEEIEAERLVFPRPHWDSLAVPETLGLPTESWWEVNDRRARHRDLVEAMLAGAVDSADAAVRANLDLEKLAVDVIDALDSPDDVVAAWACLSSMRILDPTCGSGAFLLTALNILHRLYGAVLDAAEVHARTSRNDELASLLDSAASHPNRDYFLLKHAALRNIYGVDLMPEAVEIARLRLFLKLISQVERREDIQPLPDLEFSIRAGNALVGASSRDEIMGRIDLLNHDKAEDVLQRADETISLFRAFADVQETGTHRLVMDAKERLLAATRDLRTQLDQWWWESTRGADTLEVFKAKTAPLHWLVEFPEALSLGGFDVVVGNPPYVARRDIDYVLDGFLTRDLPDIYAPCLERALSVLRPGGRLAMITPHSLMQSRHFRGLRSVIASESEAVTCSSFARIPSGLFENDVRVRNTILLCRRSNDGTEMVASSRCRRWYSAFRPHLMALIRYADIPASADTWPFCDDARLVSAFSRIRTVCGGTLERDVARTDPTGGSRTLFYKGNAYNYLSVALEPVPVENPDGSPGETSQQREMHFTSKEARDLAYVFLAGRIGLAWWAMQSDDFDVTQGILLDLPGTYGSAPESVREVVSKWAPEIALAQSEAVVWKMNKGKRVGNWDLSACRDVTDQADLGILRAIGCSEGEIEAIWTLYERVYMGGAD